MAKKQSSKRVSGHFLRVVFEAGQELASASLHVSDREAWLAAIDRTEKTISAAAKTGAEKTLLARRAQQYADELRSLLRLPPARGKGAMEHAMQFGRRLESWCGWCSGLEGTVLRVQALVFQIGAKQSNSARSGRKATAAVEELRRRLAANPRLTKTAALKAMADENLKADEPRWGSLRQLQSYCRSVRRGAKSA